MSDREQIRRDAEASLGDYYEDRQARIILTLLAELEQATTHCVHNNPLTQPCAQCQAKADDSGLSDTIRLVNP